MAIDRAGQSRGPNRAPPQLNNNQTKLNGAQHRPGIRAHLRAGGSSFEGPPWGPRGEQEAAEEEGEAAPVGEPNS